MISPLPPPDASFSCETAYTYTHLSIFSTNVHINYHKYINILLLNGFKYPSPRYFHIRHNVALGFLDICKSCSVLFYEKVLLRAHFAVNEPPGLGPCNLYRVPTILRRFYLLCLCCTNDPPGSHFSPFHKSKLRNRSLLPKSRGRSIRQGGRLGDTYRRYKTCH